MAHTVSEHVQFNASIDPFGKRMPFASLISRLFKATPDVRKQKSASRGFDALSHAELADLGLQQKFNGTTWYIDRISR
jgi:hypothetical protein